MKLTSGRALLVTVSGLAVAGAALFWSAIRGPVEEAGPHAGPPPVQAPDTGFRTVEGTTRSLADYRERVVILNIWGTWCPPCIREIPHLVEVQRVIEPRGGTVIGLAVDSGSSQEVLSFWADRLELDPAYPLWLGTNRQARSLFEAFGLPNTLIIDGDGMIRERFLGLVTRETLLERVEPYLE